MERAERVDFEIEERDGRRLVVRGLRGGVNDEVGPKLLQECQHSLTIADIERSVAISGYLPAQALEYPTGVSFWAEEHRAMIAVDSEDLVSLAREIDRDFGSDKPARARH